MLESVLPAFAHEVPTDSELRRVAGPAALLAAIPAGIAMLAGGQGVGDYLVVLALIGVVTLGVFAWAVPSALRLDYSGPTTVAVALSGLGLLTVFLFWTGLPPLLAAGGIVVGRTQLEVSEDRFLALVAVRTGAAAIVLYVLVLVADLL